MVFWSEGLFKSIAEDLIGGVGVRLCGPVIMHLQAIISGFDGGILHLWMLASSLLLPGLSIWYWWLRPSKTRSNISPRILHGPHETSNSLILKYREQELPTPETEPDLHPQFNSIKGVGLLHERFLCACAAGDLKAVELLLSERNDVMRVRDSHARTGLMLCCEGGHLDIAQMLLARGDQRLLEDVDDIDRSPLKIACDRRDVRLATLLLNHGADAEQKEADGCGRTLVMCATMFDDVAILTMLLDKGARIEATDRYGHTALMIACQFGRVGAAKVLLKRGASLDAKNEDGLNALALASRGVSVDMIELLLRFGADIGQKHEQLRLTPLMHACERSSHCNFGVISCLLDKGSDINARAINEKTVFLVALSEGCSISLVKMLINRGARIDLVDSHGENALHYAAYLDKFDFAMLLASSGSDPLVLDNESRSAVSHYGIIRSTSTTLEKQERAAQLMAAFKGHQEQIFRDENWSRRCPFMIVLTGCGYHPLADRLSQLELERLALGSTIPPPESLDTPQKRHAHVLTQVFSNPGLIREIGGYL